jgi:hypothetical protein
VLNVPVAEFSGMRAAGARDALLILLRRSSEPDTWRVQVPRVGYQTDSQRRA